MPKRIVLTGFMGAGKSTLGPRLAQHLNWIFIDLDEEIVRAEQKSIADLFDSLGEARFRDLERDALAQKLGLDRIVLALGGGAIETAANRQLIQQDQETLLLYLEAPLDVLIARCEQQQLEQKGLRRPVFEKRGELTERFQRRRPLYEAADWTIDTTGQTLDELVVAVVERWDAAPWNNPGESLKARNAHDRSDGTLHHGDQPMTDSRLSSTYPSPTSPPRWVRGDILFAFAIGIALYLAWLLRDVLILLYVSALSAVVLMPVVHGVQQFRIRKWHPSHGIAILIIMVGLIGTIVVFLALTLPPVVREVTSFVKTLPGRSPGFLQKIEGLPILRDINLGFLETRLKQDTAQHAGTFVTSISNGAAKFFEIITGIILTIYFLAEGEHVYHWFLSLVPQVRRERLDETLRHAGERMGRWLLGQLALMLILGISSGIVFGAIHLRYAFALAVLMGAFNIIPVVGALVTTSIAMLIAASESWEKVLAVLVFELVYLQIENGYLVPRIMKARVDLAGTAVFIALLMGVSLAGVAGALVAVPTAVLVAVLIDEYVIQPAKISESSIVAR